MIGGSPAVRVDALLAGKARTYTRPGTLSGIDKQPLAGDPPNPINPPSGCRFHPRCALASPVCSQRVPQPVVAEAAHAVACLVHEPGSGHPMAAPAMKAA